MPTILHRNPHLPWEITDAIIDFLHGDIQALGLCGVICSDWLTRSRHHMFSTVQLWPWRVTRFFELADSQMCTFTNHINRIELDDAKTTRSQRGDSELPCQADGQTLFSEAMSQSHIPCLSRIRSMQIRNVDWTTLTPPQQTLLRSRLAKFSELRRLELQNVIFHDMREVVRIVDTLPMLEQLGADVNFMKYLEHTLASAATLRMPSRLKTIEVGTEEGIPVILTCLGAKEGESHIVGLKLQNVRSSHLQYIRPALEKGRKNIHHVSLNFAEAKEENIRPDDFAFNLNFSRLSHLRTLRLSGLRIPKASSSLSIIEKTLATILSTVESSFLETISLEVHVEDVNNLEALDWRQLERVLLALHFFGMSGVHVVVDHGSEVEGEVVDAKICGHVPYLNARGALMVHHPSKASKKVPPLEQGEYMRANPRNFLGLLRQHDPYPGRLDIKY